MDTREGSVMILYKFHYPIERFQKQSIQPYQINNTILLFIGQVHVFSELIYTFFLDGYWR